MKKKILCVFLSVAVLVSMFAFSFSVSAKNAVYERRWVDADAYGAQTYWYTWTGTTKEPSDRQQRYCKGSRFDGSPGGYVYTVDRANSEPLKTFSAYVDFCPTQEIYEKWGYKVVIVPGETLKVTLRGYIEGDLNWDKTWYHIYTHSRDISTGVWSDEYIQSMMFDGGQRVDYALKPVKVSDTKATFYLSFYLTNTAQYELMLQGFHIDIVTHTAVKGFNFGIYDVVYQFTDGSPDVESEFDSVDDSTDDTVAISGFFSFLNKPLNNILNFLRRIGDFVWSKTPTFLKTSLDAARAFFDGFGSTLSSLFQTYFVTPLVDNFNSLVSHIKSFISDPIGYIKTLVENIKNTVVSLPSNIWNSLPAWLQNSLTAVWNFTVNFYDTISSAISNFFETRLEDLKNLLSGIGDAFRRGFSAIVNIAKVIWTGCTFISSSLYFWAASLGYLPGVIGGCMVAVIALAIVKMLFSL